MAEKRMRVFAGPNGSGKTTIINSLHFEKKIPFGVYVNADDIENQLILSHSVSFDAYQLSVSNNQIEHFFRSSTFSPVKRNETEIWKKLSVIDNILQVKSLVDSYLAADIAEFIRQQLLINDCSFTFETVMSHQSKIEFMQKARDNGYKVYLYFIATEDPAINISRVNIRVAQRGHSVAPNIITDRYYRSLQNLKMAVSKTNRAYIWDNSGRASKLIAEVTDGIDVKIFDTDHVPLWFVKYLAE
jgi:predicted ABC-type ATPase